MSKKKVLLRGVFINRDTNGEGVLKVGTTLIRVSTVMGILYSVNQDIKKMIDEMYKCIEDKKYDEAEKIVDILDKKTNGYADGISKARILISRGKRREAN